MPPSALPPNKAEKGKKGKDQKRQTRFSILVEKNKPIALGGQRAAGSGFFGGRGSIAWENPQLCSTIMQGPNQKPDYSVLEEEDDHDADSDGENMDDTVIDSGKNSNVSGLLKVIENLKNELIEAKQKNIRIETETRTELCEEFNKMMVEIETDWEKKLQNEKDRAAEYSEWRIGKMQEALDEKRSRQTNDETLTSEADNEELEQKTKELETAKCELEALKNLNCAVLEEKKDAHER